MTPSDSDIENLIKIKKNNNITFITKSVGDEKYRLNVYEKYTVDGSIVPRSRLITSRYLCNKSGLRDMTL